MGRRKGSLGVQPADTYVCSVCKFEAKLLAKTNDHIVKEHIGQVSLFGCFLLIVWFLMFNLLSQLGTRQPAKSGAD